jgi:hypothetical protein
MLMSLKETIHWFSNIQYSIIMPGHQVMALDTANRRITEEKGTIKVAYNANRMSEKITTHPRKWVPFFRFFSTPLSINKITAFFIHECPYIEGASELPSRSNVSSLSATFLIFFKSSGL